MTLHEARNILDAVRAGGNIKTERITHALVVTGDLDDNVATRSHQPIGTWERQQSASMLRPAEPFDWLLLAA